MILRKINPSGGLQNLTHFLYKIEGREHTEVKDILKDIDHLVGLINQGGVNAYDQQKASIYSLYERYSGETIDDMVKNAAVGCKSCEEKARQQNGNISATPPMSKVYLDIMIRYFEAAKLYDKQLLEQFPNEYVNIMLNAEPELVVLDDAINDNSNGKPKTRKR